MKPLSASHIDKWKQCQRREAFIYRLGIREPSSPAAEAGQAVHSLLEGKEPEGPVSAKYDIHRMAGLLKEASPALVKQEYEFTQEIDGIWFTGRIDGWYDRGIEDFKTTSKRKYVKTVRKLTNDVQRLLYVEVEPTASETLWLYGVWEDFSVEKIFVPVDRKKDRERFKLNVLASAEEILACPEDVDPLSLPAASDDGKSGACALFPPHGCPFKERCFPVDQGMMTAMGNLMDELEKQEQSQVASAAKPKKPIGTLYIDCFPIQLSSEEVVTQANVLIAAAANQVAEDQHVHHALLVDFKGGPMIAAQLAFNIREQYYAHVVLETKSAESRACVFKLTEMAENVVKGFF